VCALAHLQNISQMSVRAQPFTKYHEKICSDHMVFMPTWMAKQPHDMNLANEADFKLLSYGGSVHTWIHVELDIVFVIYLYMYFWW